MKRTYLIGALATAAALLAGGAWYYQSQSPGSAPRALRAVLKPFARTVPDWRAYVTVLGGTGVAGVVDGPAPGSRFADPYGVAIDADGAVLVADGGDSNRIRRIGRDGAVSTVAGGAEGFADGAPGTAAFNTPSGIAFDRKGNLYVADTGNHAVRRIARDGVVTTIAGDGKPGYADGTGAAARFNGPVGVAVDEHGNIYVADTYNDRIRRIAPDGTVTTLAGTGKPGMADGPAAAAAFDTPTAIVVARDGTLFVADTGNDAIRRIGADGAVSTYAAPQEGERRPLLRRPVGLALARDGWLYVAVGSGRILQLAPDRTAHALEHADQRLRGGYGNDGTVRLFGPRGLALDSDGSVVVADATAYRVERLGSSAKGAISAPLPPPQLARSEPMPWPVSPQFEVHEVVGLMGEVRGSYDGEARDHFHAGLDVRADVGERVLVVAPSKVTDPYPNWGFGQLGEGMSVGPLSYIHMRVGRDSRGKPLDPRFELLLNERGKPERVRVRRGTRFAVGDPVGTINAMAHVHLEYYPGGPHANPLALPFTGLSDTIPPRIHSITLYDSADKPLRAKKGQPLRVPRTAGELSIVVDAWDQLDGNLARRRLGLYKLGYQLLKADGTPLPGFEQPAITQVYDRLPRNRDAVKLLYAPQSGITVYGSKSTRFAYAINNRLLDGQASAGSWRVDALAPGDYILRIHAADFGGRTAIEGRDLTLTIE